MDRHTVIAEVPVVGIIFGKGNIAVSTGTYKDQPAVLLRDCTHAPGVVGSALPLNKDDYPLRAMLLFPTIEQARRVLAALVNTPPAAPDEAMVTDAAEAIWEADRDNWLGGDSAFYSLHPDDVARLHAMARAALTAALTGDKA